MNNLIFVSIKFQIIFCSLTYKPFFFFFLVGQYVYLDAVCLFHNIIAIPLKKKKVNTVISDGWSSSFLPRTTVPSTNIGTLGKYDQRRLWK